MNLPVLRIYKGDLERGSNMSMRSGGVCEAANRNPDGFYYLGNGSVDRRNIAIIGTRAGLIGFLENPSSGGIRNVMREIRSIYMKIEPLNPRLWREIYPIHGAVKRTIGKSLSFVGANFINAGGLLDMQSNGATVVDYSRNVESIRVEPDVMYARGDKILIMKFSWKRGTGWWREVGEAGKVDFNSIKFPDRSNQFYTGGEKGMGLGAEKPLPGISLTRGPEWDRQQVRQELIRRENAKRALLGLYPLPRETAL